MSPQPNTLSRIGLILIPILGMILYVLLSLFHESFDGAEVIMLLPIVMVLTVGVMIESVPVNYDGLLDVLAGDTSQIHQLEIITPPSELLHKDSVIFLVRKV